MYQSLIFSTRFFSSGRNTGAHRIATILRDLNWECEVIDFALYFNIDELKEVARSRITLDTKIIGFSVFSGNWDEKFDDLCKWIKEEYPHTTIVVGSQEVLKIGIPKDYVDYFVDSFGDYAITAIAEYIAGTGSRPRTDLDEQARSGKRVIKSNTSYPAFPMKSLKIEYEDRDFIQPEEFLGIEVARGCKFKCSFCSFPILGVKGDYSRDADDFEQELRRNYDKWGVKNYYALDETFNDVTEKIAKFADAVDRLDFEPWFGGFLRGDLLANRKQDWEHLARMRFFGHYYGIESLNHASAKAIGKGMKTEKIQEGLLLAKDYFKQRGPYRSTISIIAGLPNESIATLDRGYQWLEENWSDQSVVYFPLYIPLDGTTMSTSGLSTEWAEKGYRVSGKTREQFPEYTEFFKRVWPYSETSMVWETEYMDLFTSIEYVHNFWDKKSQKFGVGMWDIGTVCRDYKISIDEALKLKLGYMGDYYNDNAIENAEKFVYEYKLKKLNYISPQ
jgi:radical SAM superfamily enzyme YgiQ (UPF0313 family)